MRSLPLDYIIGDIVANSCRVVADGETCARVSIGRTASKATNAWGMVEGDKGASGRSYGAELFCRSP